MKTVAFKIPTPAKADAWVAERDAPPPPPPASAEQMKRFTIDVPVSLHTRIKVQCAAKGVKMADVIREMLEREFQPT